MTRFAAPVCSLLAALVLAACSKETPAPAQSTPAPAEAPASEAQPTPAAPAAEQEASQQTAGTPTETITETDDAAETEAPSTSVQPSLRLGSNAPASHTSARFKEGTHYRKIVPAQPTGVSPGKVEVVEIFWYGCPHCFTLDPAIESWRARSKPAYVEFVRVPAMWNDQLRMHARLFYTAEALGKLDELHTLIFREIQVSGNYLNSVDKITAFFRQHGVSPEEFQKTFSSFAVESKLQRADVLNRRYGVDSVPMMVVNGKYATQVDTAGGEQALFALIGELAASEHGGG
jgi:protein dithiol oxidoreductase (disulfide-forming)